MRDTLKQFDEKDLEERHVAGYRRNPPQLDEFDVPEHDRTWGDETWE